MPPAPAPALSDSLYRSTIFCARSISLGAGAKTSLASGIWLGWMHHLPTAPRVAEYVACFMYVEVFRFAGEKRATIHTHVRSMTIEAMQEVLANAVATGAPLHIVHVNSMALGEIDTVLDLIGGARRPGLDVTTEAYPYTAGSTSLHSSIFDEGWHRLGIDGDLQWEATGERLTPSSGKRGTVILHFMMDRDGARQRLGDRRVRRHALCPEGLERPAPTHGSWAATSASGARSMMTEDELPPGAARGVDVRSDEAKGIQVGADADIVVFDPDTVIDTATFEGGLSFSEGIRHTMVNGVFVVRDGETVEGVAPGRAIVGRFAREP